jgi:pyruvate/2-oxoglutarate dehydrogenase complex dihydrolipoamide dehydrogenase (E3) component
MTTRFDATIIGTGQAGPFLAQRLAAAGQKVAIVERKLFGGTCVNTGCIPQRQWWRAPHAAHVARCAADFGITIAGTVSVVQQPEPSVKVSVTARSRATLTEDPGRSRSQ